MFALSAANQPPVRENARKSRAMRLMAVLTNLNREDCRLILADTPDSRHKAHNTVALDGWGVISSSEALAINGELTIL